MSSTVISADLFCIKYGENNRSLLQMFDLFSKNSEQYFCSVSSLVFCWMQKDGHIISGAADIYFSAENEIIPLQKALLHISGFLTERFSFVQELLTYAGAIVNNTLRHFSSFFHFDEYSQRLLFSNLSFKKKSSSPISSPSGCI